MTRFIIWVIAMLLSLNSHAFYNFKLPENQVFSSRKLLQKTYHPKFNFIPFEFTVDKVNNNLSVAGGNSASISVITTGSNLTYKWQVSTNNGTSYTNLSNGSEYSGVSNSTLVLNSVNASMQGYMFRCEVSDGTTSDYSGITTLNILASPLCSSNPISFGYEYVSEVVINGVTIQGSTDFLDTRGYRDFTNIAIPAITAGTSFPVSVTVKTNDTYEEYVKFWLDFDKNGVPGNTANELVFDQVNTFNGTHTYSGNISIPADALNGTLYARMIMQYAGSPNVCGAYSYGNTYDFKIPITGGQLSQTLSVAVNKAGNSNGGVTSSPTGINTTGNIFSVNTLQGVNYSLTATPSAGSKFLGWSGDIESLQNPLTFTIESDLNILAKFAPGNLPTVVIKSNEVLSSTSVTVNAEVTDLGDAAVTERGFVIGTSQNPTTTSGTKHAKGSGLGVFSHTITGLNTATTYYLRAYAINAVGTTYSDQQQINLNKISQTITASNISATFGDAALLIGASTNSALPLSYTSSNNTIAEPYQDTEDENKWKIRFKKAGSVTLTIAQSGNETYNSASKEITISIAKKPITITATANQNKVFGEANPVYTYTPSPALLGTDAFTGALAREAGENVGTYDYNLGTLSAGDNYDLTLASGSSFAITKKAITITATADQKKVFGEANPVYAYTPSPALLGTDTFTGALAREAGENVGSYDYNLGTLSAGDNYDLTLATGSSFAITKKAITITATANQKKVFGEANPVYAYTPSPALLGTDAFTGAISRATGENVGTYDYNLGTLTAGDNYELSLATGSNFAITKKAITITATANQKKVFGESNPVYTYTPSPALLGTDSFTGALSREAGENVGTYDYNLGTLSAGDNYDLTLATGSNFAITQKAITITPTANQKKVFGEANPVYTYTFSPALLGTDAFTGALAREAGENVGSYDYNLGTLTAGSNYELTLATGSNFAITKKAITITAAANQKKVFGEANPVYTYTPSPALLGTDAFTGALAREAGENVGSYDYSLGTLTAGSNYELTLATGSSFAITKKAITITATANQKKVFGESNPVYAYTFIPALLGTDAFTGALAREAGENVGTYDYNLGTLTAGSNYELTLATGSNFAITKKAITITPTSNQKKVFGEANPVYTYSPSPALLGTDTFTGALTREAGENVGSYDYSLGTLTAGGNYELTLASGSSFAITKKAITITPTSNQKKVFGEANPVYTYSPSPALLGTDTFTGALSREAGENVGSYDYSIGTLTAGGNYDLTLASGSSFAITKKAITITPTANQKKVFGEANPVYTYTPSPALLGTDAFTGALAREAGENVGTYDYNLGTLTAGDNYDLTLATGSSFAITKKAITITPTSNQKKVYGEANPVYAYTPSPALLGTDAFTGALTREAGENVGTYDYNLGTLTAGSNYELTLATGTSFAITKKAITITATANQKKVFGEANPVYAYTPSPALLGTDTFTGALTREAGENVGTYDYNLGTLTAGSNYELTLASGSSFAITKKAITITATANQKKVFGEANPVYAYTPSPALLGTDTFTGALARTTGENVGNYNYNLGTLTAGSNYELTLATGSNFAITKKAITITATANQKKVYGDTNPVYTYTPSPALLGTDAFTGALARAAGENVGSYDYSIGTLTAGGNYELSLATGSSFAITKKAITITPTSNQKKVYGEINPTYTFTVSPALVTGDTFSGTLTRAVGENIGAYLIQQGDLAAGPNYETTFSTGILFEITKRPISVTVTPDQFKVYGEEDPDLVYQIGQMGLVNGDTFTGKLTRDIGDNVGQYPIKLGTLKISDNYELTYVGNYFNIAARILTIMATGVDKMYDGTTVAQVKFTDNRLPNDQLTLSYASANFVSPNIGNNIKIEVTGLKITGLHANNYSIAYPELSTLASITKRTLSVRANDLEKVYGDLDPVLTYTVSPELVNDDSFTGSLSRTAGEKVGQYSIGQGTLAINSNYEIDFVGAQLSIKPKPILISPQSVTKTYGDSDPVLSFTHQPLLNNDNITGSLIREVGEDVGNYNINLGSLKASENYLLSLQPAHLTIEKALLLAKAKDMTMCEGANLPTFSISYSGFKRGENEGVLLQPGMVNTNANKNSPAGVYSLVPTGVQALNYRVEYQNGLLTITKSDPVKITANTELKVKTGTTITLTATGGVSYTWDNAHGIISGQNSATLIVRPTQNTTYTVNVVNANGCLITASIQIEIIKENSEDDQTKDPIELVKGTNVITPNGDGINDNLVIKNIELFPNNEIIIFDLAGRVVYRKKGYDNSWAGTLNGIPLAKGTYYYIIDFGDNKTKKKGFVSIVRN